jgi:hypothetical protein
MNPWKIIWWLIVQITGWFILLLLLFAIIDWL